MILRAENLKKQYRIAGVKKQIIDGIDLTVAGGQVVSIAGRSGCGKTTLLNIISGITRPDSGRVYVANRRMMSFLDVLASRMRNREIGFIFQTFRLLNDESVLANVLLPARIRGRVGRDTKKYADEILERLMIYKYRNTKTAVLSGGQKQRVAIARALVNRPGLILADEPTANLDKNTAREIYDILLDLKREGKAVLIVTHDDYMQERSDLLLSMDGGRLMAAK